MRQGSVFDYLAIFGIVVAAFVGAITFGEYAAGRDPLGCNYRKAEEQAANNGAAALSLADGSYQAPRCAAPKNEKEYELCQQRRAAGAAEDAACVAWWQAWISAIGLGALVVSVVYAGLSAEAARDAAQAANANALAVVNAERSFVDVVIEEESIRTVIAAALARDLGPEWDDGHLDAELRVRYHFKNYGKTPATITDRSQTIKHADDLPLEPTYFSHPLPKELVIDAGGRSETLTCRFMDGMRYSDVKTLGRGDTALFFFGHVKYVDAVSPEPHERRFIWFYEGGGFNRSHLENYHKNT